MDISVVIPVFNEKGNVKILHKRLLEIFDKFNKNYEIIFVDDHSTDGTFRILKTLPKVTIIRFRKNFGQTAALDAGFHHSTGKLVISMDGDLQNDPRDIPRMLNIMKNKNIDVLCGWRAKRKDSFEKKIFSKIASLLRNILIKDPVHDSGCTLRIYKHECFDDLHLMGDMHRYIPAILRWKGFKIAETKVTHRKRKYGITKYGMQRIVRGFLDLFNVWFWRKFSARPLHIFGGLGMVFNLFGILCLTYSGYLKIIRHVDLSNTFLPVLGIFSMMIGVQFFVSGIMADIMIKIYYKTGNSKSYNIHKIIKNE